MAGMRKGVGITFITITLQPFPPKSVPLKLSTSNTADLGCPHCTFSYLCLRNCECPDRGMGSGASWDMWGKIRKMEEHVREITVDRGTHESWDMWGKLRLMEEHTKEVHFEPALQSLCLDASPKSFLHPRYLKLSDVSYFHSIHNHLNSTSFEFWRKPKWRERGNIGRG